MNGDRYGVDRRSGPGGVGVPRWTTTGVFFGGGSSNERRTAVPTAHVASTLRPQPDQTVRFTFDEAALYRFDAETGDSLKTKTAETSATVGDYVQTEGESA